MSVDQKHKAELRNKQLKQLHGNFEKIPANKNSKYQINDFESHLVHVVLEMKQFNQTTGEKESKPFVQKFHSAEFERMISQGGFTGYSVEIIHDPKSQSGAPSKSNEGDGGSEKSLNKMNVAELRAKWLKLYGEEAAPELKKDDLIVGIEERIEFLNSENQNQ